MQFETEGVVSYLLSLPVFRSDWVLYLLMALSIASVAVMLERWWFYRRRRIDATRLERELTQHLARRAFDLARELLSRHDALETRVVLAGLAAVSRGPSSVEDLVSGELGREKARYERRLDFLATLASNAPYIGLFGTVLGIIRAFRDLSARMTEASAAVMAGIAEALVATAVGLLVAIPAVVAFNVFKARVRAAIVDGELLARVLLSHVRADSPTGGDS